MPSALLETMPVASATVGAGLVVGFLLALAFPGVAGIVLALPLLAAAVATPLIVQARKPVAELTSVRDAAPMNGPVLSL